MSRSGASTRSDRSPLLPDGHTDLYYLGYENGLAAYDQGDGPGAPTFARDPHLGTADALGIQRRIRLAVRPLRARRHRGVDRRERRPLQLPGAPTEAAVRRAIRRRQRRPQPASPNLQTFNPLFPSGTYFNLANPIGPQNIIDLHPVLDLNFGENVTATADWDFFWRREPGRRDLQPVRSPHPAGDPEPGSLYRELPLVHRGLEGHAPRHGPRELCALLYRAVCEGEPAGQGHRLRDRLDRLHVLASSR